MNDFAYKSMLIYLARLNILEAFSTEFQTASESDKKKITKYLIDHIRNPLRELASKIVIEDETAEKKAHLDYEQSSPSKYGMLFIFERNSGWGVRVYELAHSEPGCLVEEYGLERITKAFKIFPKDVSELSRQWKACRGQSGQSQGCEQNTGSPNKGSLLLVHLCWPSTPSHRGALLPGSIPSICGNSISPQDTAAVRGNTCRSHTARSTAHS